MEKKAVGRRKFTAVDAALVALFAAIIAVCSWISINMGHVPFTLQTFAVFMSVALLGTRRSVMSVVVYILLGAVGVPVFAGFNGGISALLGTTGGYIVGFVFLALVAGIIIDKFSKKVYVMYIALITGLLLVYAFGTAWFMVVYFKNTGPVSLAAVLGWCVLPYIVPDLIKMTAAVFISRAVGGRLKFLNGV